MNNVEEVQKTVPELEQDLLSCQLNSSWLCTSVGLALAIPAGVIRKSYNPIVYFGLTGTMLDLLIGVRACEPQRKALAECLNRAKEAAEKPRADTDTLE